MHRTAIIVLAWSATVHANELRAPSIERGLEQPSQFSPANAFDSDPATSYCAPWAHLSYRLSDADAAVLEHLEAIKVSAADAGARTIAIEIYFANASPQEIRGSLDKGDLRLEIPRVDKRRAMQIDIDITPAKPNRLPVCIGEITLLGAKGALELPDLRAAVDKQRIRDHDLGASHSVTKAYVAAFRWTNFNPRKKTSDWESAAYDFSSDGTFTRTSDGQADGKPTVETGNWRLDRSTLVIDQWRVPLTPCVAHPGYFCGDNFIPTAAE